MKFLWCIGVYDWVFDKWAREDTESLSCYDENCLESSLWIDTALDYLEEECPGCTDVKYTQTNKMGFKITFVCEDSLENVGSKLDHWECGHYHTVNIEQTPL